MKPKQKLLNQLLQGDIRYSVWELMVKKYMYIPFDFFFFFLHMIKLKYESAMYGRQYFHPSVIDRVITFLLLS